MSIDYHLTLAASIPPATMLERIAPCLPKPLPATVPHSNNLGLDLTEQLGYDLTLSAPRENTYVGGSTDDGEWSRELPVATTLSFGYFKFYEGEAAVAENIVAVVAQVLSTGDEDLSFTFEYDRLYLLREGGAVTKYSRAQFWYHYPALNRLVRD